MAEKENELNAEQIAKLKEVALKAPKNPGEWPFYLRSFQAAANPAAILELIALAEHSLSAQDEVLTDEPITFDRRYSLAQDGFGLERNDETGEYVAYDDAVSALHAALAAAPSPAVVVEPSDDEMEDPIMVPRGLIGAACYLIHKHAPESKLLGKLRDFTTGKYATPSPSLAVRDIPREPTSEMMEAANRQREVGGDTKDCWRAMWDAAMWEQT